MNKIKDYILWLIEASFFGALLGFSVGLILKDYNTGAMIGFPLGVFARVVLSILTSQQYKDMRSKVD